LVYQVADKTITVTVIAVGKRDKTIRSLLISDCDPFSSKPNA